MTTAKMKKDITIKIDTTDPRDIDPKSYKALNTKEA